MLKLIEGNVTDHVVSFPMHVYIPACIEARRAHEKSSKQHKGCCAKSIEQSSISQGQILGLDALSQKLYGRKTKYGPQQISR